MKRFLAVIMLMTSMFLSACKEEINTNRIYVFSQPGCGHCENAHIYMERYYQGYDIKELNIREGNNMDYMLRYARKFNIPQQTLGTPLIIMGDRYVMGWGAEQIKQFNRYVKDFSPKKTTEK